MLINRHKNIKSQINVKLSRRPIFSSMMSELPSLQRLHSPTFSVIAQHLFYSHLDSTNKLEVEGATRQIFRIMHSCFDTRKLQIENVPKYQSISKLIATHWDKLIATILMINLSLINDFLQRKLSII